MLTPREAVLNRNAAELAGREKIETLNAAGNKLAEKGVDLAGGGDKNMKEKMQTKQQSGGNVDPIESGGRVLRIQCRRVTGRRVCKRLPSIRCSSSFQTPVRCRRMGLHRGDRCQRRVVRLCRNRVKIWGAGVFIL